MLPGWVPGQRPRWVQPRVRRALMLATGLVAVALFPYPLYVTEPCSVLPARRLEIRARTPGLLAETRVDEGSRVLAGDVVARLEDPELEAALHRARATRDRLAAIVAKLRAGSRREEIERARTVVEAKQRALSFAEATMTRQSGLFERHLVGAEDHERALQDRAEKAGELALAEAELQLLKAGSRREDVESAQAELRRAALELADLERKNELLTVVSQIEGTVVTPKFREHLHQRYAAGATICEVADLRRARIEIYVPEREFDVLAEGQATTVKVQSFPLHPFTGKVDFIGLTVEELRGERVVRVVTEVDNGSGLLREHMAGYGEINTGRTQLATLALRRLVRWIRLRFLI